MHSRYQFNKSGYKIYTIYSVYSFNRDDADCVGRLIHLALEVDTHVVVALYFIAHHVCNDILLLPCLMVYYIVSVLFLLFFWCPCMAINVVHETGKIVIANGSVEFCEATPIGLVDEPKVSLYGRETDRDLRSACRCDA